MSGGGSEAVKEDALVELRGADGVAAAAEKKGDAVLLVVGAVPKGNTASMRAQIWKGWKRERARR